jgi:hypothetical protein
MLNNCREFLIRVRSTLTINCRSKRRKKRRDKLHQINKKKKKLKRLKLKLWLEDGPRQAFRGHGNYDAYNSNVPSFRPSPGSRSTLAQHTYSGLFGDLTLYDLHICSSSNKGR